MNDVVAAFNEYFEIIHVDSPELLRDVFRLRYQVLCIEQRAPALNRQAIRWGWKAMTMIATHPIFFCATGYRVNLLGPRV